MIVTETKLAQDIRSGALANVYFLYGRETYLVELYTERIIKKAVGEDSGGFNYIRLEGNVSLDKISDAIDAFPVFADYRVVLLNDFDIEKLDNDQVKQFLALIEQVPATTIFIINLTSLDADSKKAKMKKLIAAADANGCVAECKTLTPAKVADMIAKKAKRANVEIKKDAALYLAQITLLDLTLVGTEVQKLCDYVESGGEITRDTVDLLVAPQLEANIFELSTAIISGNGQKALSILQTVLTQGHAPVMILSALSAAYLDYYRAKLGQAAKKSGSQIAADFHYAKNRTWVLGKVLPLVTKLSLDTLRNSLDALSEADIRLKSSPLADSLILEQTLTKLLVLL